jgi:hypothetical protein
MAEMNITAIVESFVSQITAAVEASVTQRMQAAIAGAFGAPPKRGPGRPPKQSKALVAPSAEKRKRPKQLCPVPGCKNLAAPVFGMVCKAHRKVAKSKIKKYREERQGKPTTAIGAKVAVARKVKKATPKAARARRLQGQYMGSLRSLTGTDREKVKQLAKTKGIAEAVKLALSLRKPKA